MTDPLIPDPEKLIPDPEKLTPWFPDSDELEEFRRDLQQAIAADTREQGDT